MIVRKMQPIEFDVTVNLFGYYRDEAIESIPRIAEEYDEDSVIDTIRHFASHWDHIWYNLYDATRPVGFVSGFATECPWNKELIVANIGFMYIIESHRNMDNFKLLLGKFEEWSKTIGAYQITAGDIGINIDRSSKLYEHFGFKPILLTVKEI
jgi:GNAT superfamily N-acetyltransferase